MKIKLIHIVLLSSFILGVTILSGCEAALLDGLEVEGVGEEAAAEGIAAEDMVTLRDAGVASDAAGDLVISNETEFYSTLERVRLENSPLGNPKLYISSESEPFAEVIADDKIRLIKYNKDLTLPGDIYTVEGDLVNVRTGPGFNYKVLRRVSSGQLVLVKAEENGWYRVQIGYNMFGYIAAALLSSVVLTHIVSPLPVAPVAVKEKTGAYHGEPRLISNGYLETSLISFKVGVKEIEVELRFTDVNNQGHWIGIAFKSENNSHVPDLLNFTTDERGIVKDNIGNVYNISEASGLGYGKTANEWKLLSPGQSDFVKLSFTRDKFNIGDLFSLSFDIQLTRRDKFFGQIEMPITVNMRNITIDQ